MFEHIWRPGRLDGLHRVSLLRPHIFPCEFLIARLVRHLTVTQSDRSGMGCHHQVTRLDCVGGFEAGGLHRYTNSMPCHLVLCSASGNDVQTTEESRVGRIE